MYSRGPTVYAYQHIGNMRDTLKRTLLWKGYEVRHVINITDVGHLTSDADAGDDKLEIAARRERRTIWEIAEHYTGAFKEDLAKLRVLGPNMWPKATDHIDPTRLRRNLEVRARAALATVGATNTSRPLNRSKPPEVGAVSRASWRCGTSCAWCSVGRHLRHHRVLPAFMACGVRQRSPGGRAGSRGGKATGLRLVSRHRSRHERRIRSGGG
jgi:hypothetical protein